MTPTTHLHPRGSPHRPGPWTTRIRTSPEEGDPGSPRRHSVTPLSGVPHLKWKTPSFSRVSQITSPGDQGKRKLFILARPLPLLPRCSLLPLDSHRARCPYDFGWGYGQRQRPKIMVLSHSFVKDISLSRTRERMSCIRWLGGSSNSFGVCLPESMQLTTKMLAPTETEDTYFKSPSPV